MKVMCAQCGEPCTGYFQYSVCSPCYSENVRAEQKRALANSMKQEMTCSAQQSPDDQTHE